MHPAERKQNLQRLQRELKALRKDPVPGVHAVPLPANMLEWHYVIEGPPGSPYQGGFYHGIIRFPQEYPFKPPSIRMLTPSGRFEPNQRICLSMSDFHPETWNCMWSVSSILQGVVSFMLDSAPAIGTVSASDATRRQLARRSMMVNCQDKVFRELFEDLVAKWEAEHPNGIEEDAGPGAAGGERAVAGGGGAGGAAGAAGGRGSVAGAVGQILVLLALVSGVLVAVVTFGAGEL